MLLGGYRPMESLPPRIAGSLGLEIGRLQQFLTLSGANLADPLIGTELWSDPPLPNPVGLTGLFSNLVKLNLLLRAPAFDAATLDFINLHEDIFGLQSGISMESVRKVSVYVLLATGPDPAFTPPVTPPDAASISYVLATGLQDASLDLVKVAAALCTDRVRIAAVLPNVIPSLPAAGAANCLSALQQLAHCVELANYLGVDGQTFKLAISDQYADLRQAAGGFYAAFRTKYPDEKTFFDTIEAFDDQLRGRRRDALTDYLLTNPANRVGLDPKGWVFNSKDELSTYFLVDVQLEGYARTSRVVAATSSVQLYVQRVLMNLEQSRDGSLKVSPQSIPQDEWVWRKNYRVWEANRKVFLYPENYIEPELRDDKTPLFKELKDTLLQQEITEQNVIDAYAKYMAGFEEVANLEIAGSYQDIDKAMQRDILHLIGVTHSDPPIYYYRTIENSHFSGMVPERRIRYSPWRTISIQIPVRRVSPIVYQGKLFIFWAEILSLPKNEIQNGSSTFKGYCHKISVRYSFLRLDDTWSAPQTLVLDSELKNVTVIVDDSLIITIPAVGSTSTTRTQVPIYETKGRNHYEPREGYSLQGYAWEQVYPSLDSSSGDLLLDFRNFRVLASLTTDGWRIQDTNLFTTNGKQDIIVSYAPMEENVRCLIQTGFSYSTPIPFESICAILARDVYSYSTLTDYHFVGTFGDPLVDCLKVSVEFIPLDKRIAVLNLDAEVIGVNGNVNAVIIRSGAEYLMFQMIGAVNNSLYRLLRLNTTTGVKLSQNLFAAGLRGVLDLANQKTLKEAVIPISFIANDADSKSNMVNLDVAGPFGTYYREIFFQIPFLIANHLNSQQKFSSSQQWYNYIFNPTAPNDLTLRNPSNRVWQYLEFRNLDKQDPQTLREILTDDGAN